MLTSFIILSLAFCRAGDGKGELLQGLEVVAGEEYVDVRERGRHSTGQGLVAGFGLEGVHPDHAAGKTRESLHALREHFHVSSVPAVREDYDRGAAGHAALSPQVHELLDGVAESGSPRPVLDGPRGLAESPVRVPVGELAGHAGEPGTKDEGFYGLARSDARVHESQERPAVGGHRTGDVAQENDPTRLVPRLAVAVAQGLAASAQGVPDGPAGVAAAPGRGTEAPALPQISREVQVGHEPVKFGEFLCCAVCEVLLP